MADETYLVTAEDISAMKGLSKTHFLNPNAQRVNKSLGDATGLTGLGIHVIEVSPGCDTTEPHMHHHEDEAVFVLSGTGTAEIGDMKYPVKAGDFVGYRKGGLPHNIRNSGTDVLRCLVIGQRLEQDVAVYPRQAKRIFRNAGLPWDLVDHAALMHPQAGAKK